MTAAAGALVAVGVLDAETAADVVAEAELALAVRLPGLEPAGPGFRPGRANRINRITAGLRRTGTLPFLLAGPITRSWGTRPGAARRPHPPAGDPEAGGPGARGPGARGPGAGGAEAEGLEAGAAGADGAERIVAAGATIGFRTGGAGAELYLMSFAQTAAGARFHAVYGLRSLFGEPVPDGIPVGQFGVTDDRGRRYRLEFARDGGPGWISILAVRPGPPTDAAWLEIAAPGEAAVRIELEPASMAAHEVRAVSISPGENLLIMMAERLLTVTPELPRDLRRQLSTLTPGSQQQMATGFGEIVAALEAADVLPPLSPVPGRLAALCASLGITDHGITTPPAPELPEPWFSLLTHYQRRKPDVPRLPDGFAAVTASLPELDGIRLALLGLENRDGRSSLHVLTRGLDRDSHPGLTGLDFSFPLSVWVRDSGGRWHAGRAASWHPSEGESVARLHLLPPLPADTAWIEVVVSGQSAEVRTRLLLQRGYAP